jgi:hypothetical protein
MIERPFEGGGVEQEKRAWLELHLRCPACAHQALDLRGDKAVCGNCGRTYRQADGVIDFLDDESLSAFNIASTENVSDHPFDGSALAIIEACAVHGGWVLDCGSGYKANTFPNLIQMEIVRYPNVDLLAVNQQLPFVDGSFDAIFSLDVLEHVNDPWTSASEIKRVLRPGGVIYLNLPFLQAEHGYPHHYFNATRMGAQRLFEGMEVLSHHVPLSGHPFFTLHHLLMVYLTGLPEAERAQFANMTVSDLLARGPMERLEDPLITQLAVEQQWQIAATTQALFRKPGGDPTEKPWVTPDMLPEFPDYIPPPPPAVEAAPRPRLRDRFRRTAQSG